MANKKKTVKMKRTRRMLLLGLGSVAIIITMTLTIGKYWVDIFDKYREKQELEEKLAELQAQEKELKLDANKGTYASEKVPVIDMGSPNSSLTINGGQYHEQRYS